MNQQEIFEYIKKQYPANPERIIQSGKQITIFKNQRNNIPYAIFYQSDESVMSIMEVQAESDMISNYIEMPFWLQLRSFQCLRQRASRYIRLV